MKKKYLTKSCIHIIYSEVPYSNNFTYILSNSNCQLRFLLPKLIISPPPPYSLHKNQSIARNSSWKQRGDGGSFISACEFPNRVTVTQYDRRDIKLPIKKKTLIARWTYQLIYTRLLFTRLICQEIWQIRDKVREAGIWKICKRQRKRGMQEGIKTGTNQIKQWPFFIF